MVFFFDGIITDNSSLPDISLVGVGRFSIYIHALFCAKPLTISTNHTEQLAIKLSGCLLVTWLHREKSDCSGCYKTLMTRCVLEIPTHVLLSRPVSMAQSTDSAHDPFFLSNHLDMSSVPPDDTHINRSPRSESPSQASCSVFPSSFSSSPISCSFTHFIPILDPV